MLNKCSVAILTGGLVKRLRSVSGDIPKPMVKILYKSCGVEGREFENLVKSREGGEISLIKQIMQLVDFVVTSEVKEAYDHK